MRFLLSTTFAIVALGMCLGTTNADDVPGHRFGLSWPLFPRLMMPSETRAYVGYHVGGGNPFPHFAEPRYPDEGTWGWDYQGLHIPRRVINGWWHGRRYQGGTGAYKTEGPKAHPD